jgi:FtsH-binding integral membrane protein
MYVEIGFNILYLIVVWTMTAIMSLRLSEVPREDYKIANLFRWAFFLLALGDTGHVGFRVAAYALGGLEQNGLLVGVGALATAVTVTFFYVVMLYIWKERFDGKFGRLEYILLASVPVRMIVMAFPQNDWGNPVPPAFWGPFRNLFLVILGVGVLYLYLRDSIRTRDRLFRWMGYCVFFSYLFYTPVILFARDLPIVGMLMIPKTIMYVAIQFLAFYGLWPQKQAVRAAVASPADD